MNGNSQAAATRQKMSQLEQMLSALDQLRRVGPLYTLLSVHLTQHPFFEGPNTLNQDSQNFCDK